MSELGRNSNASRLQMGRVNETATAMRADSIYQMPAGDSSSKNKGDTWSDQFKSYERQDELYMLLSHDAFDQANARMKSLNACEVLKTLSPTGAPRERVDLPLYYDLEHNVPGEKEFVWSARPNRDGGYTLTVAEVQSRHGFFALAHDLLSSNHLVEKRISSILPRLQLDIGNCEKP